MNAKISSAHVKYAYNQKTNRNGKMMLELSQEKSLCIVNTKFQKRMGKRWTFESPKGDRSMLDYILVNNKWINSVKNAEAYSSFESVGSDHRIVTMEVKLSLRVSKSMPRCPCYDWKALRYDKELQCNFSLELKNKFNILYDEGASITDQYTALVTAKDETAKDMLPEIKRKKQHGFANRKEVVEGRKEINRLTKSYGIRKSKEVKKKLNEAKVNMQKIYKKLEDERLGDQIDNLENYFKGNDAANAWKIINTITNRKKSSSGKLSGKTPDERVNQWYNHFKTLLGVPSKELSDQCEIDNIFNDNDFQIDNTEFTIKEYLVAKKQVKEGKAPGEDGMTAEVFKRCDIDQIVLRFANKILMEHEKPDQLSILNIVTVPKKGDLSITGNYRGISLASITTKLVNRMILNRIRT